MAPKPQGQLVRQARRAHKVRRGLSVHRAPSASAVQQALQRAGPPAAVRVVTGTDAVTCADNEILAGLVCASGATDGAKCATPSTTATGLCVRR
jgi:hypothetical protein